MFRHKWLSLVLGIFFFCTAVRLFAEVNKFRVGKENFSKGFKKKWGSRPIIIRQQYANSHISGSFPDSSTVERCAKRFYTALDYLPEGLIRKTRLKYVTFLTAVKLNGKKAGGVASGDTIFLSVNFNEKTVFHEFFHIFDPHHRDKKWTNLNEKRFVYSGSRYYKADLNSKEQRQVRKNKNRDSIRKGFVSDYAMSFEHEDRAETFAYMIVEGKSFLKRTKNPVIKAKMEYIMALFVQRNLLDNTFWEKHFGTKFNVKNRLYSSDEKSVPGSRRNRSNLRK